MKISLDKREVYTIFSIGETKLNTLLAPEVKMELLVMVNEGVQNIILDLSAVEFIDSSGLSAILVGHRACKEQGGVLVLTGINPAIERLLHISQLQSVLVIIPSLSEAKDYVMMHELGRQITDDVESESNSNPE
ncbi:MAG: STAS domain-containing protein [Chitinophagales bacterium]|nr:STAS domain-containing protein [Bacteroidota bacterium]MCB9044487.1 STAS domain-containing protein [Chitinophagales bacterium]